MKNKLFIIAASFALLALCGTANAQSSNIDTSSVTRVDQITADKPDEASGISEVSIGGRSRLNTFSTGTRLESQTVELCGNGSFEEGEECEFRDGVEITTATMATRYTPICSEDTSCNPDTCRCERTPICGDGVVSHASGEQCEVVDANGEVLTLEKKTMLCQRSRIAGLDVPESTAYDCDPASCVCILCGNGVVDPGEECDGTPDCNSECKKAPAVEEQVKCSIKTYGYSNNAAEEFLAPYLARQRAAIGLELLAEEVYGRSLAQIIFPDGGEVDANGDVKVADTAILHVGGAKLVSIHDMSFRPLQEDVIDTNKAVLLFPFSANQVPAVQGVTPLTKESLTIDLSSMIPEGSSIEADLNEVYGDVELNVVSDKEGALNKRIRFMVQMQSPTTKTVGEKVGKTVDLEFAGPPMPAGFGTEGEVIAADPEHFTKVVEETAAEWKAAGKDPVGNCDIIPEIFAKLNYTDIMKSQFKVVSGNKSVPIYTASVITQGAFGGRGTSTCSLTGAGAGIPDILLMLGMMAVAVTGVGIVRRRKR